MKSILTAILFICLYPMWIVFCIVATFLMAFSTGSGDLDLWSSANPRIFAKSMRSFVDYMHKYIKGFINEF